MQRIVQFDELRLRTFTDRGTGDEHRKVIRAYFCVSVRAVDVVRPVAVFHRRAHGPPCFAIAPVNDRGATNWNVVERGVTLTLDLTL